MPTDKAYALASNGDPKIIIWDEHWPQFEAAVIKPSFHYVLGVTPKKNLEQKNICPIMIRPEFRLSHNGKVIYSSICEVAFMLHILKPNAKPHKNIFFEAIKIFVHPWYKDEFLAWTGRSISLFYNLRDSEKEILRAGERVLRENGW